MGVAVLVLRSSSISRTQWDDLLNKINAFLTANPTVPASVDKGASQYIENPP